MEKNDLQKLRDLSIVGVAERLGLTVKGRRCLCPFHADHHPSMSLKASKNTYRCYVCGASGDNISLVMGYLNKDFREACRWLADESNIILTEYKPKPSEINQESSFDASRYERFFEHPWLNDEARKFLFDERRLDPRVVRWCRLTSWKDKQGVPWLQIPYYNREGKLIGIQNRNLGSHGDRHLGKTTGASPRDYPRFRFPQGAQCTIYNLPILNLLKPGDTLFITEGCSDCWAMLSAGHKAIAIPSATLLKRKDAELLEALSQRLGTKFGMYPDRDEPGERLFLQLKEVLPRLVHYQLPKGTKDFSDYYVSTKRKEADHG